MMMMMMATTMMTIVIAFIIMNLLSKSSWLLALATWRPQAWILAPEFRAIPKDPYG